MKQPYFGFYWTYPVPRVGFTELPKDVDEAARASTTIAYSRAIVRDHVARNEGVLVRDGEMALLEQEPDRGSKWLAEQFSKLLDRGRHEDAYVAIVVFSEHRKWRGHQYLAELYKVDPCDPICLDHRDLPSGVNPYEHFKKRKASDKASVTARIEEKPLHREDILATLRSYSDEPLAKQAAILEAEGLKTFYGRHWTAANLRRFLGKDRVTENTDLTILRP